jgi:carboxyl-terminal processing protease
MKLNSDEAMRNKADPDFQWLVNSIAANDKERARKSLSLNLVERKAERETFDTTRLARENSRRKDKGQTPFATIAAMEASDDVNGEKAPDILLDQTAQIMADIVADAAAARTPPRTVAKRQESEAAPAKP